MELTKVFTTRSGGSAGRVRLYGEVSYDTAGKGSEVYWFEVPEAYAEFLSSSGNPWLVCLLPLAMTLGEPLRLCAPVDRALLENIHQLMDIWRCWYPDLRMVSIEAETFTTPNGTYPRKTAAFFSGGVDSFFTVLRHHQDFPAKTRIDDLLCIWGFDIPLKNADAYDRMREVLSRAAADLGTRLIDVATNLRETAWAQTDWAHLSHGCALASVALALEPRYGQVLIAASGDYRELSPWGSHILTDPLLSTGALQFIYDGSTYNRLSKTAYIAKSEVAMRSLRVCWRSETDENCGSCEKCVRTILALDLIGGLERCITFDGSRPKLGDVKRIYIPSARIRRHFSDIRTLALQKGRRDIARAIDQSMRNSARWSRWLAMIRSLKTRRFVWRWVRPLEHALRSRFVN